MIINLYDSAIGLPPRPTPGAVELVWNAGGPLPPSVFMNIGMGQITLMRIIAPMRDMSRLVADINRQLPSFKALFSLNGVIEIYGRAGQRFNTIGGTLGRDAFNTIGGALSRDPLRNAGPLLNTIGGSLRQDLLQTIGGALTADTLWRISGTQRVVLKP